jgi:hypothetical protein
VARVKVMWSSGGNVAGRGACGAAAGAKQVLVEQADVFVKVRMPVT